MKTTITKYRIAEIISTYFYIGKFKYAPGTYGSFFTIPLFFLFYQLFILFHIKSLLMLIFIYMFLLLILFLISYWAINIYINVTKKDDPSEVVIDEVIGQLISYIIPTIYIGISIKNLYALKDIQNIIITIFIFCPFIFFRFFDILKPSLVGYFDKNFNNAFGIIMDDVFAGIYASLSVILLLFICIKFLV